MADIKKNRRRSLRLGIVLFAIAATMSLGVTFTLAAPPFSTSISVDDISELAVTVSGTADSPSNADHHMVIEWGDGNEDVFPNFTSDAPWSWGPVSHTYAAGGTYTIVATLIHATPNGNDQGSASSSTTVTVPGPCTDCPTGGEEDPGETDVRGNKVTKKVTKKVAPKAGKLAKTGPEHIALSTAGLVFLLTGVALRMVSKREEL